VHARLVRGPFGPRESACTNGISIWNNSRGGDAGLGYHYRGGLFTLLSLSLRTSLLNPGSRHVHAYIRRSMGRVVKVTQCHILQLKLCLFHY